MSGKVEVCLGYLNIDLKSLDYCLFELWNVRYDTIYLNCKYDDRLKFLGLTSMDKRKQKQKQSKAKEGRRLQSLYAASLRKNKSSTEVHYIQLYNITSITNSC